MSDKIDGTLGAGYNINALVKCWPVPLSRLPKLRRTSGLLAGGCWRVGQVERRAVPRR
jgi:hypothetical protein